MQGHSLENTVESMSVEVQRFVRIHGRQKKPRGNDINGLKIYTREYKEAHPEHNWIHWGDGFYTKANPRRPLLV